MSPWPKIVRCPHATEPVRRAPDCDVQRRTGFCAQDSGQPRIVQAQRLLPQTAHFRGFAKERDEGRRQPSQRPRHQADIAVRMMVRPKQEALLARRISDVTLGLHAHRQYLQRHGTPATLAEPAHHSLIGFDTENAFIRSLRDQGLVLRRDIFGLGSDSDLAHLACIRAGYGIGVCQVALARRDDHLVHVLPKAFRFHLDTWVVMHEDLRAGKTPAEDQRTFIAPSPVRHVRGG